MDIIKFVLIINLNTNVMLEVKITGFSQLFQSYNKKFENFRNIWVVDAR